MDLEELEEMDASEIHAKRLNARVRSDFSYSTGLLLITPKGSTLPRINKSPKDSKRLEKRLE